MKHAEFTLGHDQHGTLGILSTMNGFLSGEKQMLLVDTDDGESASWSLEAWPCVLYPGRSTQGQPLVPSEGPLRSELL